MATGAVAQLLAGLVYNPIDIIKERMQGQVSARPPHSSQAPKSSKPCPDLCGCDDDEKAHQGDLLASGSPEEGRSTLQVRSSSVLSAGADERRLQLPQHHRCSEVPPSSIRSSGPPERLLGDKPGMDTMEYVIHDGI